MKNFDKTICLTGHRPKGLPWGYNEENEKCKKFLQDLTIVLRNQIENGYTYFLTGMAEGFDMLATELLIALRKEYKKIKVIAIIPCLNQENRWSPNQQKRYHNILRQCNSSKVLSKTYTKDCMNIRNKFMVEHSELVIACYNGTPSGTGNTIKFARQMDKKIIIINPDNYA